MPAGRLNDRVTDCRALRCSACRGTLGAAGGSFGIRRADGGVRLTCCRRLDKTLQHGVRRRTVYEHGDAAVVLEAVEAGGLVLVHDPSGAHFMGAERDGKGWSSSGGGEGAMRKNGANGRSKSRKAQGDGVTRGQGRWTAATSQVDRAGAGRGGAVPTRRGRRGGSGHARQRRHGRARWALLLDADGPVLELNLWAAQWDPPPEAGEIPAAVRR